MAKETSDWQESEQKILDEFEDGPAEALLGLRRQPSPALRRQVLAIPADEPASNLQRRTGWWPWGRRLAGGLAGTAVLLLFLSALFLWSTSLSTVGNTAPGAPLATRATTSITFSGDANRYPFHRQSVYAAPADDLPLKQAAFRELGIPIMADLTAVQPDQFDIIYLHPQTFAAAETDELSQLYWAGTVLVVLNTPVSHVEEKLDLELGMEDLQPEYFDSPDYFTAVVLLLENQFPTADGGGRWLYRDFFQPDQLPFIAGEIERRLAYLTDPAGVEAAACPATPLTEDEPPDDPNADPFGRGDYYINDDRTIWAGAVPPGGWQTGGEKVLWIRPAGSELQISGQLLDGDGPSLEASIPCCYPTGFQITGLTFPVPGCWLVSAQAGASTLQFVTEVQPQGYAYDGLALNEVLLETRTGLAGLGAYDGQELVIEPLQVTTAVGLTLTWQAGGSDAQEMTLFLHLYDQAGNLIAQLDDPLAPELWVGPTLATTHRLPLPANLPPGRYTLTLGLYNPTSFNRILFTYAGQLAPNGVVTLTDELEVVAP